MKTFRLGAKRIETRLFVRHDDGEWAGYTYEWNAAGTDAKLAQPDRDADHPGRPRRGRLRTLEHIGLFGGPLVRDTKTCP